GARNPTLDRHCSTPSFVASLPWRWTLRTPAARWAGGLDRHPVGCGPGVDQIERYVRTGVREQARALADDHEARQQIDLVDQLVFEQPAHQGAASVHLQLTARLRPSAR